MLSVMTVALLSGLTAQELGHIRVEVFAANEPVIGAEVVAYGTTTVTDNEGRLTIGMPLGTTQVTVLAEGYLPLSLIHI